jgi:hypothetical protein
MATIETINEDRRQRKDERLAVSLPVTTSNGECTTRDVSASGMFLESNSSFVAGEFVDFSIEFEGPGGGLMLKCNGEIVRVEDRDGKIGVAVKIVHSVMESVEGTIFMGSNINVLSSSAMMTRNRVSPQS